jgi:hypothetical protein
LAFVPFMAVGFLLPAGAERLSAFAPASLSSDVWPFSTSADSLTGLRSAPGMMRVMESISSCVNGNALLSGG